MTQSPPAGPKNDLSPNTAQEPNLRQQAQGEPSRGGFLLFLAQRVFLYFVLYALSIGPLYWQWYGSRFVGGSAIVAAFYQPLVALAEWIPPFGAWMDWYVSLWIA